MKWMRPQATYVFPNPSLRPSRDGGLSSPLFSDNGRFVCVDWLPGASGWSIVEDPMPHLLVDGADFYPLEACYFGGAPCWAGGSESLHFSVAHNAWIIQSGTPYSSGVPTAYRDWATDEWKGSAWYEAANLSFDAGATTTFAPKGTLLNDSGAASRTVQISLPRWQREEDGFSSAPFGKYVGMDGKTGVKFVGPAAYGETGTRNVWYRTGEGRDAYLKRENADEQSTARRSFPGPGAGWGIVRGDVLYFASELPAGESGATFSPWTWDEESGRYVPAEDADPLELTYKGRTMGKAQDYAYFTEVALWR